MERAHILPWLQLSAGYSLGFRLAVGADGSVSACVTVTADSEPVGLFHGCACVCGGGVDFLSPVDRILHLAGPLPSLRTYDLSRSFRPD
jgi:hypothetical protein